MISFVNCGVFRLPAGRALPLAPAHGQELKLHTGYTCIIPGHPPMIGVEPTTG